MKAEVKLTTKIFVFIMALLILIASLPVAAFANLISEDTTEATTADTSTNKYNAGESETAEVYVLEENEALRGENVKHFKLTNGITKAVVYPQAVHYKDESGKWIDINNALTLNGTAYSTKNKSEIKFANKSGSTGLVSIKDGEYKIDFTPVNVNKVNAEIENPQSNSGRKFEDMSVLNNIVSKAIYKNILDGIDFEYVLVGNNIKENIIVKEKQNTYSYSMELKLDGMTAEMKNGSITLSDADTGEAVYTIPAPYMYDSNGAYSEAVEYTLVQNSKWKYTLTVTASAEWINAQERAFPVTIDPTVVVAQSSTDTFMTYDNTDYGAMPFLMVGNFMGSYIDVPGFIKFNVIEAIPNGNLLVNAKVAVFLDSVSKEGDVQLYLGVFEATDDWVNDEEFSYSNSSEYYSSSPIHSVEVTTSGVCEWNITELYKKWLNGEATNNGICIKAVNLPSDASATAAIRTIESVPDYVPPMLEITYVSSFGIEDYYGYAETSVGNNVKGYVNLYNGSLTYINKLTSVSTPNLTYDINMVYNSIEKTWTPSFNERITVLDYDRTNDPDTSNADDIYIWTDPDGTAHSFAPYLQKIYWGAYVAYEQAPTGILYSTTNPTVFYPEDDIDYVLTKTSNNEFILKDYQGNQRFFDFSGKLTKICNAMGDVLYFYHIKQHNNSDMRPRVSSIVYRSSDGVLTDQVRLDYDTDNDLRYVYNVQTQMETSIDWHSDWRINSITYNFEDLDNYNVIDFAYYRDSKLLGEICDSSTGEVLQLSKDNSMKYTECVKSINGTEEHRFDIDYEDNQTNLTETKENETVVSTYAFDENGRKQNVTVGDNSVLYTYNDTHLPKDTYYSVVYNSNVYEEPYGTADEAAMAFAIMYYSASRYILHEYGAYIYSCTYNDETTYNFTNIVYGDPHGVSVYIDANDQRNFIASVHTHPQGLDFSDDDIDIYVASGVDGYLAIPGNELIKYNVSNDAITDLEDFSPVALTERRKNWLVNRFRNSWNNHISANCGNGFNCNLQAEGFWPHEE